MHQDLRALAEDVYGSPPPAASPASLPSGVIIRTYVLYVHTIHHPTRFLRREPRKYGREKNAGEEPLESTLSPFLRGGARWVYAMWASWHVLLGVLKAVIRGIVHV